MKPRLRLVLFFALITVGAIWAISADRLNVVMAVGITFLSAGITMAVDKHQRGGW